MIKAAEIEQGVLIYERFISGDKTSVHVVERYESSETAAEHLRMFADRFGAALSTLVKRKKFSVYGNPSDELRDLLDQAVYMKPFGGFAHC